MIKWNRFDADFKMNELFSPDELASRVLYSVLCATKIVKWTYALKVAGGSADLKISESAILSLNHHNFLNTESIYTE